MPKYRVTRSFLACVTQVWDVEVPDDLTDREDQFDQFVCDNGKLVKEFRESIDNDGLKLDWTRED